MDSSIACASMRELGPKPLNHSLHEHAKHQQWLFVDNSKKKKKKPNPSILNIKEKGPISKQMENMEKENPRN